MIEPVDDMNDNTQSSNPKLLAYLEKIMASIDYDVKEFMRVLYSMDLFTRDSVKDDHKGVETFYFAGPPLQRMKGEQIWDSLVTLVYNDIDSLIVFRAITMKSIKQFMIVTKNILLKKFMTNSRSILLILKNQVVILQK